MSKLVIVTPVANEEATIGQQIDQIAMLGLSDCTAVYVIDSFSTDRTRDIIAAAALQHPWVRLCFYPLSTGVVSCYLYGLRQALALGADYVIEMDAGLSHDPALIPVFLKGLQEGHDCVFGSRFMRGGGFDGLPWQRIVISWCGTVLANFFLGTGLTDMTSGYEAFRRDVLQRLPLEDFLSVRTTHFYQTEMRFLCHRLNVKEIPIVYKGSSTSLKSGELWASLKVLGALRKGAALSPLG